MGEDGFSPRGYETIWFDDKTNLTNKMAYTEFARTTIWGIFEEFKQLWEISTILDRIM